VCLGTRCSCSCDTIPFWTDLSVTRIQCAWVPTVPVLVTLSLSEKIDLWLGFSVPGYRCSCSCDTIPFWKDLSVTRVQCAWVPAVPALVTLSLSEKIYLWLGFSVPGYPLFLLFPPDLHAVQFSLVFLPSSLRNMGIDCVTFKERVSRDFQTHIFHQITSSGPRRGFLGQSESKMNLELTHQLKTIKPGNPLKGQSHEIFFASWLSYKHFKMTPRCLGHRGVTPKTFS